MQSTALPQRKRRKRNRAKSNTSEASEELECGGLANAMNDIARVPADGGGDGDGDGDCGAAATTAAGGTVAMPVCKFEYLDHTADVQLHAWGVNLKEAFEQCAQAMFGYMTQLERVSSTHTREVEVQGHDMLSLLYKFLDEMLYGFCADEFCVRDCHISTFDTQRFRIRATSRGETFDLAKHTQGTEIKAITYSNMQVHDVGSHSTEGRDAHVYVIVDI